MNERKVHFGSSCEAGIYLAHTIPDKITGPVWQEKAIHDIDQFPLWCDCVLVVENGDARELWTAFEEFRG